MPKSLVQPMSLSEICRSLTVVERVEGEGRERTNLEKDLMKIQLTFDSVVVKGRRNSSWTTVRLTKLLTGANSTSTNTAPTRAVSPNCSPAA